MKACDIRAALERAPELTITSSTTAREADAAFPKIASFNQGGIFVGRFSGRTPWEWHPADELLYVLDGEVDVVVLTDDGPVQATVSAGSIFVVPGEMWHRQIARSAVTVLGATPHPTRVSFAEDPRREG
jgi:quercetin dioxygenase-like cupin family protein